MRPDIRMIDGWWVCSGRHLYHRECSEGVGCTPAKAFHAWRDGNNIRGDKKNNTISKSIEDIVRLRDALRLALDEIDWWSAAHSCCQGHETRVVDAIEEVFAATAEPD